MEVIIKRKRGRWSRILYSRAIFAIKIMRTASPDFFSRPLLPARRNAIVRTMTRRGKVRLPLGCYFSAPDNASGATFSLKKKTQN